MIWHYDKSINSDIRKMFWNIFPVFLSNISEGIKNYLFVLDVSKKRISVFGANSKEVKSFRRVVKIRKTQFFSFF